MARLNGNNYVNYAKEDDKFMCAQEIFEKLMSDSDFVRLFYTDRWKIESAFDRGYEECDFEIVRKC